MRPILAYYSRAILLYIPVLFPAVFWTRGLHVLVVAADTESVTYLDASRVTKARRQSTGNMTASQLARKRANDRLAQRAMRARNKAHVESLEAEVRELRVKLSEQNSTALQQLIARNYALENELVRLMEQIRPDGSPSSLPIFHDAASASTCTTCFDQCSRQENAIQLAAQTTEATLARIPIASTNVAFPTSEPPPTGYGAFAGLSQLTQEVSCGCRRPSSQHSVWGCILGTITAPPEQRR